MITAIGYFRNSFLVTLAGLGLGALLGWETTGSLVGALSTMFIVAVLAILEVSLSFDNAVVNATGLIGAGFIVTAFLDSIRYNRRMRAPEPVAHHIARE